MCKNLHNKYVFNWVENVLFQRYLFFVCFLLSWLKKSLMIDWLIDFNGMSNSLELFYALSIVGIWGGFVILRNPIKELGRFRFVLFCGWRLKREKL